MSATAIAAAKEQQAKDSPPPPLTAHDLIETGDAVYWYAGGNRHEPPHFGWVSRKGIASICIHLLRPTSYAFAVKDGVLHLDDPRVRNDEKAGGWDFAPLTRVLVELRLKGAPMSSPELVALAEMYRQDRWQNAPRIRTDD